MSIEQAVADLVKEIKAKIEAARQDGKLSGAEIGGIVAAALSFAAGKLVEFVADEPVPGETKRQQAIEALTKITLAVYDEVLVPIDIPYVPAWIETKVEAAGRVVVQNKTEQVAAAFVDAMYDLLKPYLKQ